MGCGVDVVSGVPVAGFDANAIHDNVAAEISAIALKAVPVAGDFLVIEDSAAADAKKRITIGTLPGGGGGGTVLYEDVLGSAENLLADRTNDPPTRDNTDFGQVNLGSESLAAKGTKNDYATIGGGLNNLVDAQYGTCPGGNANILSTTGGTIGGGWDNELKTNAFYSVIGGGIHHEITGAYCVIIGGHTNAIGSGDDYSAIIGGVENTVDADYCCAGGRKCDVNHIGNFAWSDSRDQTDSTQEGDQVFFAAQGGVRVSDVAEDDGFVDRPDDLQTLNAAATTLYSRFLTDNTAVAITARVTGMKTDGSERAFYIRHALIYRDGGIATIQGAVDNQLTIESDANWDCTIDVDGGNNLRVRVTGVAATTINWRAKITHQQVS